MLCTRLRIIVTGLAGLYPVGGVAWDYLQYAAGFARLGHDVYYHEDTWSWPYHPIEKTYTQDGSYSAQYIGDFFKNYATDLQNRWHYLHLHETSYGMERKAFDEVAKSADILLNVSGACIIPENLSPRCVKIFLDTDPGYNQIMLTERFDWSENVDRWCESVAAHDRHFTYAENIHNPDCIVPKMGFDWKTTRMPVVMHLWEPFAQRPVPENAPWTTIMTWNAFKGKLLYNGVEYGSKGAEFEKLIDLPMTVPAPLKVAVGGVTAPLERLSASGWQVVDGPQATATPAMYRDFILGSRGELSTAKNVYVAMRTGWFSCRTACYLAAGRPAVVQDTGFTSVLPAGAGVLSFNTAEEAAAAIREVEGDYARHSKAALDYAKDHFESCKVLSKLIDDAL
ncbi:MAG: glycosyltransferase family 1 protein [Syntrophobacteraceae bacterium]